jgi:MFS family permease
MLILVLITAFLDILGFSLLIPVLPQITEYFIVEPSWTMWAQAIYSAGVFVSGYLIGKWSDTYGRRPSILGTSMLNLCGYALLIFALSTPV